MQGQDCLDRPDRFYSIPTESCAVQSVAFPLCRGLQSAYDPRRAECFVSSVSHCRDVLHSLHRKVTSGHVAAHHLVSAMRDVENELRHRIAASAGTRALTALSFEACFAAAACFPIGLFFIRRTDFSASEYLSHLLSASTVLREAEQVVVFEHHPSAPRHLSSFVLSLDDVLDLSKQSRPEVWSFMQGVDEETIWRLLAILGGSLAFCHATGLHFLGGLTACDIRLKVTSPGMFDAFIPPPFAVFEESAHGNSSTSQQFAAETADVQCVGTLLARFVTAVESFRAGDKSRAVAPFSTELLFLIKKISAPTGDAITRPTAAQLMQFQGVKLRVRNWLTTSFLEGVLETAPAPSPKCQKNSREGSIQLQQSAKASCSREQLLEEREAKLKSFLELYELTTETLDQLPISERNTDTLRNLLRLNTSTHSSSSTTASLPSVNLVMSHPRASTPPPVDPSHQERHSPSRQGAPSPVPSPLAKVVDLSVELPRSSSRPALVVEHGNDERCRRDLNESGDIEVIEIDDDSVTEMPSTGTSPAPKSAPELKDRLRHARKQYREANASNNNSWMSAHVAQLERMQLDLHRSLHTPPKDTTSVNSSLPRRSPSANRHIPHQASREKFAVEPEVYPSYLTSDEKPSEILRKLRSEVAMQ